MWLKIYLKDGSMIPVNEVKEIDVNMAEGTFSYKREPVGDGIELSDSFMFCELQNIRIEKQ